MFKLVKSELHHPLLLHLTEHDTPESIAQQIQDKEGLPPDPHRINLIYYSLPTISSKKPEPGTEFTAAGVLPWCVLQGQLMFLLGQHVFYSTNPSENKHDARARLVWSDFGGRRADNEQRPEDTAAREWAEETLGLFHDISCTETCVRKAAESMRAVLNDQSRRNRSVFVARNSTYIEFIAPVQHVSELMLNLAAATRNNNSPSSNHSNNASAGSEKVDFLWIPAHILLKGLRDAERTPFKNEVRCWIGGRALKLFHKFVISLRSAGIEAIVRAICKETGAQSEPPANAIDDASRAFSSSHWKHLQNGGRTKRKHSEPQLVEQSNGNEDEAAEESEESQAGEPHAKRGRVDKSNSDAKRIRSPALASVSSSSSSCSSSSSSSFAQSFKLRSSNSCDSNSTACAMELDSVGSNDSASSSSSFSVSPAASNSNSNSNAQSLHLNWNAAVDPRFAADNSAIAMSDS